MNKTAELEANIAKNIMENMTEEEKSTFIDAGLTGQAHLAAKLLCEMVAKRRAMGQQLLDDAAKMASFSEAVVSHIRGGFPNHTYRFDYADGFKVYVKARSDEDAKAAKYDFKGDKLPAEAPTKISINW